MADITNYCPSCVAWERKVAALEALLANAEAVCEAWSRLRGDGRPTTIPVNRSAFREIDAAYDTYLAAKEKGGG